MNAEVEEGTAYHGPASPWAAAVGLLVTAAPYLFGLQGISWVASALTPPIGGLVLLWMGGHARTVGTGLLAAGLVIPFTLIATLLTALVGSSLLG